MRLSRWEKYFPIFFCSSLDVIYIGIFDKSPKYTPGWADWLFLSFNSFWNWTDSISVFKNLDVISSLGRKNATLLWNVNFPALSRIADSPIEPTIVKRISPFSNVNFVWIWLNSSSDIFLSELSSIIICPFLIFLALNKYGPSSASWCVPWVPSFKSDNTASNLRCSQAKSDKSIFFIYLRWWRVMWWSRLEKYSPIFICSSNVGVSVSTLLIINLERLGTPVDSSFFFQSTFWNRQLVKSKS